MLAALAATGISSGPMPTPREASTNAVAAILTSLLMAPANTPSTATRTDRRDVMGTRESFTPDLRSELSRTSAAADETKLSNGTRVAEPKALEHMFE